MGRRLTAMAAVAALALAACGGDDDDAADPTSPATDAPATDAPATDAPSGDGTTAPPADGFDIEAAIDADLAACAPAPAGEPLKIGYAADLSDLGGFADGPGSAAAEHFVDLVNCAGGVNGTPLELTIQNIEGDPEVTVRAAQDLLDAGVSAILGPPFADFGQPLLQVTQGNLPVLFVASTEPALSDAAALSFLVAFDDTQQATAAAEFALDQGWTTAVTFSSPGPYFGYNPQVFTEVFEAGGGTLLGDFNFVPLEDVEFSTQVNQIAALDEAPAVVYGALPGFQAAPLMAQLRAAGVEPELISSDAFEATGGYVTDGVEGFFHTTHAFVEPGAPLDRFLTSFEAATGAPIENPSFGGLAVDSIAVIIDAYLRTGSHDGAALGAAIAEASGVVGVTGTLTYSGTGTPSRPVYVHQVVDGQPSLAATIG